MISDEAFCRLVGEVSNLGDSDIAILLEYSHTLQSVSQLEDADVFIDIMTRGKRLAMVVAQYNPPGSDIYSHSIIGDIMWRRDEPGVYRTLELGVPSRELKATVSENVVVRQNVSAITNADNEIIGVLIAERKLMSPAPQSGGGAASEPIVETVYGANEMQKIAEYMNDAMIRFDRYGKAVFANSKAKSIYKGLDYKDDIVGLSFENLAFFSYTFRDLMGKKQVEHTAIKIGRYILNATCAGIWDGQRFVGAVLLIKDTTEEKTKERELILKSAAIEEIHHRVKNNLQTVASLIRLQARRIEHNDILRFADEINSRIYSISVTHEILAGKGVDSIDIKELLGRMLSSSRAYIVPDNFDLQIEILGDSIQLDSGIATTIAMVVNELMQNSLKHAFNGRNSGSITLSITRGDLFSSIAIEDNGVGLEGEADSSGSMGLKLVRSLVKDKLKGDFQITSTKNGTRILFDFLHFDGI